MAKFKCIIWKVSKDQDGDVKLVLLVSQTEATEVMNIPVGVVLDIEIKPEV